MGFSWWWALFAACFPGGQEGEEFDDAPLSDSVTNSDQSTWTEPDEETSETGGSGAR